jgi:2-polyprenyl-6-methoxyphenol hydroxylase-like FAD-dependent oxidoreductase
MLEGMVTKQSHAIVVGGSIAGLLAARVLSRWFDRVTVLDRDELPLEPTHRKGVPQSRHAHGLLARGHQVIEELVPGFWKELTGEGAVTYDPHNDLVMYNEGNLLKRAPSTMTGVLASRPLIESVLRRKVIESPTIALRPGTTVTELLVDEGRLTGVRTEDGDLAADLVVDASGRSNRGPAWLRKLGYSPAPEDEVNAGLVYASREYRREPGAQDFVGVLSGHHPDNPFGCGSGANEGDRWLVTLVGLSDIPPPTEPGAFEDYSARLDGPELYRLITKAEPLTEPVRYRIGASVRRRYEDCGQLPEGFLAIGDALCCFNPVYGQGMTLAALSARVLADCLEDGDEDLTRRYFRSVAKVVEPAWALSVGGDLRFPHVKGPRSAKMRFLNGYLSRLHRAAAVDSTVAGRFLEVANGLAGPEILLAPRLVWRILRRS